MRLLIEALDYLLQNNTALVVMHSCHTFKVNLSIQNTLNIIMYVSNKLLRISQNLTQVTATVSFSSSFCISL